MFCLSKRARIHCFRLSSSPPSLLRPCRRNCSGLITNTPQDYMGVVNTINRFLLCIDKNRSQEFVELFGENGSCKIVKTGGIARNDYELKSLCESLHARFTPALHMESNICITFENDFVALNESYWMALLGGEVVSSGFHEDTLIKCPFAGTWKFKSRVIYHHWSKAGGFENVTPSKL